MVHVVQVKLAFGPQAEGTAFYALAKSGPDWVLVESPEGEQRRFRIRDRERLSAILQRDDLTRRNGRPLVIANRRYKIIGFAAGPAQAPRYVQVLAILDLGRGVMPGLPGPVTATHPVGSTEEIDDPQPDWWLLDATVERPGN